MPQQVNHADDAHFMRRCLQLAELAEGFAEPNPLVGSVIVYNNNIIGEGWHRAYGEAHAEINALASVHDRSVLPDATLYVNLEPCAHFGKTPPCAHRLVKEQIKRVVIANRDPFHQVNGKGIEVLRSAEINVDVGVLEHEATHLNRHFFTFHQKKRPYVTLKWAQTINGFIDGIRNASGGGPNWITSPATRKLVHLWRSQHMGIVVGARTVINDDPELTVRDASGRQPERFVIANNHPLKSEFRIFGQSAATTVVSNLSHSLPMHVKMLRTDDADFIPTLMAHCYEHNIQSLFIEGGKETLEGFIKANLWDEARVLTGRTVFETGIAAPTISKPVYKVHHYAGDRYDLYLNT